MTETFQITLEQAQAYEQRFVPAIFGAWAPLVVDTARIRPGQHVLDVGCGTGAATRVAADRVGPTGSVTGLDLNPAMLEVARSLRPDITWRQGDAEALPFDDEQFDVVLCQSALMFFPDPTRALQEMSRVTRQDGTVAVQVYAGLSDQPAYGRLVDVVGRHAGDGARAAVSAYWVHGDLEALRRRWEDAGLRVTGVRTETTTARFASIDDVVAVEVGATPLADRLDDATYERIRRDANTALAAYCTPSGSAELPLRGHVVTAVPVR